MKPEERTEILALLDLERQTLFSPGTTVISEMGLIRDMSDDGKQCNILYSCCPEDELDRIIKHQIENARSARYELEWKLYGHDRPHDLGERLAAAGFEAGAREAFMVLTASEEALDRFGVCNSDIRRVTGKEGLEDVRLISEEVHGRSYEWRFKQWRAALEKDPDSLCIYVVYVNGEPAASGRLCILEGSRFAGLYGGETRERFRKRGLYKQLVAARIRQALSQGITRICVDALPTSEPILRKRGFEFVTYTQPFCISE